MWDNSNVIDVFDLLLTPIYVLIIYLFANGIQKRNIQKNSYYRFLIPAITCKIIGGISICLIYAYYYQFGDPINYYLTAQAYTNILLNDGVSAFLESANYYANDTYTNPHFNQVNGVFWFHNNDYYAMFVAVISTPILLISFKSFIVSTLVLTMISFIGTWKLYEVFVYHYPNKTKEFAFAILFIPSVFFWGSGLLKDTYTFACLGLVTYCVFKYFILKRRNVKYLIYLLFFSFLIIMIKPYILVALIPGSLVWIGFKRIQRIKSGFLRVFGVPIFLSLISALITFVFVFFGQYLGDYSIDKVLEKAVMTQEDLIREEYGTNNFNIGSFEPTIFSVIGKAPIAIFSALFRPFLWDVRNPVMLISAIESSFMFLFFVFVVFKIKFRLLLQIIFGNPLLVFSLLFSLFFAFSVGLTTANFGALVRLRIPCIPFFICSLLMIYFEFKDRKDKRLIK